MTRPFFTPDEIRRAVLLIGSEEEASAVTQAMESLNGREVATDLPPSADQHQGLSDGVRFVPIPNLWLTEDTLVLLSLLSDDMAKRVAEYRQKPEGLTSPEAERRWHERRAELKRIIDARPPRA